MTNWGRPVQIASVQTLNKRGIPDTDLVIIDEAHRWYDLYETWMKGPHWADVPFIGLTATPWTRGLGRYYDTLIVGSTTRELIKDGYLSKFRVFAPASPDLTGVRTVAGDYHEGDLSAAMDKEALVADVVDTWMVRGQLRPTLCFAVDCAHAKHLQKKFQARGINAGYIDAHTKISERLDIDKRFHSGEIKVVCNVGCLTTGIDWDVGCIILARPTKSETLFVQMIGRGLRTAEGKDDCLILDHSDNHTRLGFVTDIHHEELDDGKPKSKAKPKQQEALPKKCPSCDFLKPAKERTCPACGFTPEPKCTVVHRDGELVELSDRRTAVAVSKGDKARFYQELKGYSANRGYNPGWIAHKFNEKFGHWPKGLQDLPAVDPTPKTLSWIKSRQIAYARSHAR
jgi:DNA repair protein RadD